MKLLQRLKNLFLPEGKISDGFHSFDELYHYRMLYNAAFFNSLEGKYEVHKQDATRNSISSAGQAHFSHKQLEGLNSNQIQELLFQEKGINWNDYPTKFKRGSCCIKKYHQTMNQTLRSYWFIDNEIPIFKGEDREYIEKLIA